MLTSKLVLDFFWASVFSAVTYQHITGEVLACWEHSLLGLLGAWGKALQHPCHQGKSQWVGGQRIRSTVG